MDISSEILGHLHGDHSYISTLRRDTYDHVQGIDYIAQPISYGEFFEKYLLPNRACVLGKWATSGWRSRKEWVMDDGRPDLNFLRQHFGTDTGPAADCKQEKFSSQPKDDMTVAEFVSYVERYRESGYSADMPCLYLKDWHFQRTFPDYQAYITPVFFQSDWLNEFWDHRNDGQHDDYRFVYFGPKHSWTPLHADVFQSHSWSANICGYKKWLMFPPGEEDSLKDIYGQLAFDLTSAGMKDKKKFPKYGQLKRQFEVIQEEGEVIFVPTGWHHQVFNMEDTISINHNWMNGCNADLCWKYITTSLQAVCREISDCRDMEDWDKQCQLILKASAGIDYAEFYHFVRLIGERRLQHMDGLCQGGRLKATTPCDQRHITVCADLCQDGGRVHSESAKSKVKVCESDTSSAQDSVSPSLAHTVFDLLQVQRLLEAMLDETQFRDMDWTTSVPRPPDLLHQVRTGVELGMRQVQDSVPSGLT